ncbi:2-oxoglutarate dehydrogenase E1 component [Luteitalea sp. TBR-22]|uniref:2-oxoglutarate dehydrogenase E1 component n=1 Tax=Luteitalea sp. TBR-22 TaxID=2802971 RepID=UPI001AF0CAB4|nr:2-oxoglutarate dehydrogenase E1 component [Luteitalea sp. TBR-22]BCS33442.1 2-oxoglutarate dehydrogenase E1 component [Luteitalea sp. TBR-22]
MGGWNEFQGLNAGYVLELYDRYRQDPTAVDAQTRAYFEQWTPPEPPSAASTGQASTADLRAVVGAATLAESIRRYGHLAAQIDPLGSRPTGDPALDPQAHGITEDDLRRLPAAVVSGPLAEGQPNAAAAMDALRRAYCTRTGYDFAQVFIPEEREWLRLAVESGRFQPPSSPIDAEALLDRITEVETFERFLHRTFPGKTRFSVEGLDMLIPILDIVIDGAEDAGLQHVLIGMAHRGRLNVLAHVLGKPYEQILAEFKDPATTRTGYRIDLGWTGDVKYHAGALRKVGSDLHVSMAPNPSHLEFVNPVVAGMARAAGTDADKPGRPVFDADRTLPVLIHGDAAFPGQGIVAETLNLGRLDGYTAGGTIHIIANNQLGFTAVPSESYSTSYASGLARGFKIPIVHVNADDPIACIAAARMAWAYRARFQRDFLIDLVGYRRYGHNEGDEPGFTQPLMYQRIANHPTVREQWAAWVEKATGKTGLAQPMVERRMAALEQVYAQLKPEEAIVNPIPEAPPAGAARQVKTSVPLTDLRAMNEALLTRPAGFEGHRKLDRGRERRKAIFDSPDERSIDWATAEELAYASILADGIPIRLTGEDVQRGTFSHRHAAFRDVQTGAIDIPLQRLPQARASFEIHNSPLSENATIGFEYGYNVQAPDRMVIWEAQYGDFINGAQVMLDQFVTSARAKWGQTPSLVLLLPHGYEGQGPEHSSARPERFLGAAADINLRMANCTTAAQYFHLLRRQALLLTTDPLPLIVLTPKSLLRHPLVASTPREFEDGAWRPVIDDVEAQARAREVTRVVFCSGKVYVDLVSAEQRQSDRTTAICRIEQLYPFPSEDVAAVLDRYPNAADVVWLQEEPLNMGAWDFFRPCFEELLDDRRFLRYVGRPRSASPSEGSLAWHMINQKMLVAEAYAPTAPAPRASRGRVKAKA